MKLFDFLHTLICALVWLILNELPSEEDNYRYENYGREI